MSQPAAAFPWWSAAHRLAGTTRLLVGFVIGAVFALVPMYYFYMGREAGPRGAADPASAMPVNGDRPVAETSGPGGSKPFASRMTYELSQLPQERVPPPAPVKAPDPAPLPATRPSAIDVAPAAAQVAEALPERVVNSRPISAVPPDPRDRTREIEKEARKAEYREPARLARPAPSPPVGKVIEGREVDLKPRLPDTPTRPIAAGGGVDTRAEIEAERSKRAAETVASRAAPAAKDTGRKPAEPIPAAAQGSQITGVTPITRAPEVTRSDETGAKTGAAGSKGASAPAASAEVQSRLEATREWIASAAPTTHTIQLMGTNSEEQLKSHLKSLSKALDPSRVYIFRTMAQGKPSITVVYGAYADRSSAAQALEKLPAAITANKPVLRTVNGIRAEMKQHKTE